MSLLKLKSPTRFISSLIVVLLTGAAADTADAPHNLLTKYRLLEADMKPVLKFRNSHQNFIPGFIILLIVILSAPSCRSRSNGEPLSDKEEYRAMRPVEMSRRDYVLDPDSSLIQTARSMTRKTLRPRSVPVRSNLLKQWNTVRVELDSSQLTFITPGEGGIPPPRVYDLPEPVQWEGRGDFNYDEFSVLYGDTVLTPAIFRAIQTPLIPAMPFQPIENATLDLQALNLAQGLRCNSIICMMEDSRGNLWFGGIRNGACRFDGKALQYYGYTERLNDYVSAIIEDKNGDIWFGTGWGCEKYDGTYFTHYLIPGFTSITDICETRNGDLWIATKTGLLKYDGEVWTGFPLSWMANNHINTLCEDAEGNIWIGTFSGACKWDGKSFIRYGYDSGLRSTTIDKILRDRNGVLWIGSTDGVSKFDGKAFEHFDPSVWEVAPEITDIMEDAEGSIWIASFAEIFKIEGNRIFHYTGSAGIPNGIVGLAGDHQGNLWIHTYENGLVRLKENSFTSYNPHEAWGGHVSPRQIILNKENEVIFSSLQGYFRIAGDSVFNMGTVHGLKSWNIPCLAEDPSGTLWLGTNVGLDSYDGRSSVDYFTRGRWMEDKANDIQYVYMDAESRLWVGTSDAGLIMFDGTSFHQIKPFEVIGRDTVCLHQSGYIACILQARDSSIWYSSAWSGICRLKDQRVSQYSVVGGLQIYTTLYMDRSENLWIGTRSMGLIRYNGKSFHIIDKGDGLSDNYINSIVEDNDGNLWIGTTMGLNLLKFNKEGKYLLTNFTADDGLKEPYFNLNSACLDKENRLWWGTVSTLTVLDLDRFEIRRDTPCIKLTSLDLNQNHIDFGLYAQDRTRPGEQENQLIPELKKMKFTGVEPYYNYPLDPVLPHSVYQITFNFSAFYFSAPQSIRYRYFLEGLDHAWSKPSNEGSANYRNIPPGRYTFRVQAESKAGILSEAIEYPFLIRHPWWFRWWSIAIYSMSFILLLRYYIRFVLSRERIKADVRMKEMEVEKMQEIDRMKSRFFANISHEFRTPLTLLLGPLEDLLQTSTREIKVGRDVLEIMKKNSKRLLNLINQILDISKLETGKVRLQVSEGNLEKHVRTIVFSFLSLAESKHVRYEYELPETNRIVYLDGDKVEKILINLISNAFKFTPANGVIHVGLQYITSAGPASPEYVEIKVTDNGKGIPAEKLDRIFDRFYQASDSDTREAEGTGIGLALIKELVDLYRGKINVESEVGRGSVFTVNLPVSRQHFTEGEIVTPEEQAAETKFPGKPEILIPADIRPDPEKKPSPAKDKDQPLVLIVEDNTDLRHYMAHNLFTKYRLLEADNGKSGLSRAIDNIPDLVVTDLMMPEMDGIELCKSLKTDERTSHIPVIMLTAKADRESKLEGLETGADDYLVKPFDAEELLVRIKNLIDQRRKLRERYRKEFLTDSPGRQVPPPEEEFLKKVTACIDKHLEDPEFNVEQLGKEIGLSRMQLYRKILALTDHTPVELIRNTRLKFAARMFREGHRNITRVIYSVGFSSPSYFTQHFRKLFGVNPSEYLKQMDSGGQ